MSNINQGIAIIGAGPAGLTLALLLHKHQPNIPLTIFELRQCPTDAELAKPSGMLDLHDESGQAAIKDCGLWDEFLSLTGECAEAQRVSNKDGEILYTDEGELSDRPEVSRHSLMKLLLDNLPTNSIKWDHKLVSATPVSNNSAVELEFNTGLKEVFSLVVGADGAWSKVRRLLTDVKPTYSGRHNVTLTMRNITTKYPNIAELVGRGSFSALGMNHGVMSQRGPQDSARIYIFLSTEDPEFATSSGIAGKPATAAKDIICSDDKLLGKWGARIKELIEVACHEETADNPDEVVDIKAMYTLPIGSSWTHKQGATLIGDASHLMGPWAGEGVNLAMWDSLLLSKAIIKAYEEVGNIGSAFADTLDPLIEEFEVEMAARCAAKAEETAQNGQMLFGDDAANDFTKFFENAYGPRPELE